ncbi:hypothetical protein CK203_014743 [Vitis vinifera]|uniref:Uncharacterized protein n=1 Tax=Vitis vinifera TaxID=29760 RepID=A0A438JG42_VITVI|nr:hypothetical protein CK203_014743 [Vitis vinifera]
MMNSMFVCASWDGKCSGDTVWTSLWCPQVYISIQRSTILLTATGIPLMLIYIFSKDILLLLGESSAIASAAAVFVCKYTWTGFSLQAFSGLWEFLKSSTASAFCSDALP